MKNGFWLLFRGSIYTIPYVCVCVMTELTVAIVLDGQMIAKFFLHVIFLCAQRVWCPTVFLTGISEKMTAMAKLKGYFDLKRRKNEEM